MESARREVDCTKPRTVEALKHGGPEHWSPKIIRLCSARMIVGMMAGTAIPMLLLFAGAYSGRSTYGALLTVSLFGLGYFTVWTGFSAFATFAQWALHTTAMLSPAMKTSSPRLAGVILLVVGMFN